MSKPRYIMRRRTEPGYEIVDTGKGYVVAWIIDKVHCAEIVRDFNRIARGWCPCCGKTKKGKQ